MTEGSGSIALRMKALGDRLCAEREAARAAGIPIPPAFPPLPPQPTDERTQAVLYSDEYCAKELIREIALRKKKFPEWVEKGWKKQDDADRQIAIMEQVLASKYAHAIPLPKAKADEADLFGGADA